MVSKTYEKPCNIYVLFHPLTGAPIYVGASVKPLAWRISMHHSMAGLGKGGQLLDFIRALEPTTRLMGEVLEVVAPGGEWEEREKYWISVYRSEYPELLNETAGGLGLAGRPHTAETRSKMSAWQKGQKRGPLPVEVRNKIRDVNRGKPKPPGFGPRQSDRLLGHEVLAETRAKIAASLTGRPSARKGVSKYASEQERAEARRVQNRAKSERYRKRKAEKKRSAGVLLTPEQQPGTDTGVAR